MFLNLILKVIEKRFKMEGDDLIKKIEIREQLLDLAKMHSIPELLLKIKDLILFDVNSTFDYQGKFRLHEFISNSKKSGLFDLYNEIKEKNCYC